MRLSLYFDSSVYGFIDEAGEADVIAAWLNVSGYALVASVEANVGEAIRITDSGERGRRVATITTVARGRSRRPIDVVCAEEFLGEVGRWRRTWLIRQPPEASKDRYLTGNESSGIAFEETTAIFPLQQQPSSRFSKLNSA